VNVKKFDRVLSRDMLKEMRAVMFSKNVTITSEYSIADALLALQIDLEM